MTHLDSDLLRTFVAIAQTGSMTKGAALIFRSQSAASIQIRRLEDILGHPVFERHGRGVVLSDAGRRLLPVARDVTARLDATLRELSQDTVAGKLRLGVPDDHGRAKLAQIIAAFTRKHPQVDMEVTCALSTGFPEALKSDRLDMAVYEVQAPSSDEDVLFEDPTCWMQSVRQDFTATEILPVALFDHACWWRDAAIRSLDARGLPYRVVYSSQSVSGVMAAVEAGIAVGLLGRSSIHSGLKVAAAVFGFGPTPTSKLVLAHNGSRDDKPMSAMKEAIQDAFLTGSGNDTLF